VLNPTCTDLLQAVITNLDELVLPQLEGPHARSAAKNMKLILEHVIQRLPVEGASLAQDNAEKRVVLAEVTERAGAPELRNRLDSIPSAGVYVTLADVATEAAALRQLAVDTSLFVHRSAELGEEQTDALLAPLRAQLRAQLDRDAASIAHLTPAEIYDHKGV
jgi:hypothetical protein